MTLLGIFNLRQKVCRCIYTHFDISKIYRSLKSYSAITLNLNKKTKWVMVWWDNKSYLHWLFSVGPMIFFLLKINIIGLAMLIWWWRSSKVSSRSVLVFECHLIILNYNYSWILLCYFSNNKKSLLMIYICNIYLIL